MNYKKHNINEPTATNTHSAATPTHLHTQGTLEALHYGNNQPAGTTENSSVASHVYPQDSNQNNFASLLHMVPSSDAAGRYTNNASFQQVLNFTPKLVSYQRSQRPASGYPTGPGCLLMPGLPQPPSTPGFLTGAGYHLPLTEASVLSSQRFPVSVLLPPGQAGTPLHFAAILGDKQKLAIALEDKNVNLEARDRWGRVALVFAVLGNHQECVELLLHAGAKPDAIDSHTRTPLHFAAFKGHLGCIKSILHAVESKNISHLEYCNGVWLAQDMRGVTPLHHAAVHTNHKCLQALLKYTVAGTLDLEDHKKRTPLHWAAAYGSQENVRLLIKHGANNLMPDQEGKTPLHWAAMSKANGAKDCVRTLIEAAPSSVNWQDFDGTTALHIAVAEARKDTVDVILSVQNCNVNLTDNQFRTALHWACNRGVSAIAAQLMRHVAQVDAVDMYGATPLHYAAKHNHADIVQLLVRRPRVKNVPTKDGHTSLMWAAAQGADSALTVMVRHGAFLTQADPRGCTALHIAAEAGHVSTVKVLLHLQAPPDACATDGRTAVHYAARAGHTQIVKVLAKAGASLEHRDNEGQCALHHAVLGGHLYLAQILIRAGTSVNVQDYYGRPPLHMAAYRGLSDIMFLLLENRGDVNARDFEGLSALHWAAEQGHLGAVNTLLDFHAYPNYTQSTPNRYTPYDCACIAEHLEVAQVLTEAGGISVTRIMEVAATKLQAAVRGYLTRSRLGRLRNPLMDQEGKLMTVDKVRGSRKSPSSLSKDLISTKSCVGETTLETHHSNKQKKDSNSTTTPAIEGNHASGRKEEKGLISKLSLPVRYGASEHSPYNSVSGQRRSKALSTSIMRGARKKTPRKLELPGLGELGIRRLRLSGSQEDCEDSDSGTDSIERSITPLVSEALHQSGNDGAAVITTRGHSHHTLDDSNGEFRKKWDFNSSLKTSYATKLQQGNSQTAFSDGEEMASNNENDNSPISYWHKKHMFSSCENQISKESYYQEKFENHHTTSFSETFSTKENIRPNIKERKHVLKEKKSASPKCIDMNANSRNTARTQNEKRVLNEEAVKQAEQKWKNKLATVTIQRVQAPDNNRSEVPFPYTIVKPHTHLHPPAATQADTINTKTKETNAQ